MGRVATLGSDLLDDLLTLCVGTLRTFTIIYIKPVTNSASWLYYISLVLGREGENRSLKTLTVNQGCFRRGS